MKNESQNKMMAVLLNLFFWGGGYVYIGTKKKLGIGLVIARLAVAVFKSLFLPVGSEARAIVSTVSLGLSIYFAYNISKSIK